MNDSPTLRNAIAALGWAACLFQVNPARGQEAAIPPARVRPRVGLALSGGGALGVSHIGVLKALEELRIPIHCIAGTSMGAVVGGLYASGLSPGELEAWFRAADWHFLLSDTLPRESESPRSKQREFEMNQGIAFNLSAEHGLKLPAAFASGRNVMASLRKLTVPVRGIRDFDRLPIPFRAIATDIETGDLAILRDGDFVEAMRASMSVPAIFLPQRISGRLLADGGMSNNLPVSIVQGMGADVVIAVDASEQLRKEPELDTAGAMALQVVTIFVRKQMSTEIARLGPDDLLLRVNIENMTATDFVKAAQGIDAGYQQTMQARTRLARYAVPPVEFQQYVTRQRVPRDTPVPVTFLKVQTPEGEFNHVVRRPFDFQVNGHDASVRLQSLIGDLGEMQKFEVADYEVIGDPGAYGLLVKARKKRTGPSELNFGFEFGYSSADESDFNLLLSHRMTELNSLGAEWRSDLSLGNTSRARTEWYQPVDWDRHFFLAASGIAGSDFVDGRDAAGERLRFRQDDYSLGIDIGARLWQSAELRLGYARGFSRISRRLNVSDETPSRVDRGWLHADLMMDTLDAPNFATRGTYGKVSLIASRRDLGGSDDYTRLQGQAYRAFTFGKNTIVPRVSAAVKIDGDQVPLYDQVPLGGFLNLSGLARGSLFGENFALAELVYYRKIAELNPAAGRGIYVGLSAEFGQVWGHDHDFRFADGTIAGSIFLGADTIIGGLYLGVGVAEGGNAAVYLQLGPLFGQGRYRR